MDREPSLKSPPLKWDPESLTMLRFASLLLPTKEYLSSNVHFPGSYCIPHYQSHGDFFHTVSFFIEGKKIAEISGVHLNERQIAEIYFDDVLKHLRDDCSGLVLTEVHHPTKVPVELYVSHIHRKSGAYLSYPGMSFMGDKLFPQVHGTQLENTLFWPGIPTEPAVATELVVINPFDVPMSYQISLFIDGKDRLQSTPQKLSKLRVGWHSIEALFPDVQTMIAGNGGRAALCVAAQYKLAAYAVFRRRSDGIITTIDHLHNYVLV